MTNIKTITFLVLLCIFITSCKTTEERMVLEDFNQLISSIKKTHPKGMTNTDKLDAIINEKRKKITPMSQYEFVRFVSPIISAIDCGHTFIYYSKEENNSIKYNGNFFPLDVRIIDNSIYVAKDYSKSDIPKGSIIHTINGLESSEVIDLLYNSMSSDGRNITSNTRDLNLNFGNNYFKYIERPSEFNLIITAPDNNENITKVVQSRKNPIDNRRGGSVKGRFKENYALLKVPTFNFYSKSALKGYQKTISSFFNKLKDKEIENLIVDLRGNFGGSPEAGNMFLSYLLTDPFQYFHDDTQYYPHLIVDSEIEKNSFKGNLFIIIDGGCFSTTGHVLSHLKDKDRGILIGQESGGSYICNDASQTIILKNSGVIVNLPRLSYKTSVTSLPLGEGVKPDVEIDYTIDDYLDKKDLEMDYILKNHLES